MSEIDEYDLGGCYEGYYDEVEDSLYCDYDVCEFCEDPQTKVMGLCTTECSAYLDACIDANKQHSTKLCVLCEKRIAGADGYCQLCHDTLAKMEMNKERCVPNKQMENKK